MSNDMAVFQSGSNLPVAEAFKALMGTEMVNDLAGGVAGNYAIVSMRGGKWRVKFQGNETPVIDGNGEPIPSLEIVIVKANSFMTKQYYKAGYEEGDNAAPVCFSLNGTTPAVGVPEQQHDNCALCPMNKFGSRVTDAGVQVKACQDNRKLAVVPLTDLGNEAFGGPMLFRVPASALKDLAAFGSSMKARGYPYNSVAVRLGLDMDVSYPKPTFKAIRPLTDDEATKVIELYNSDLVERVLAGEATMSSGGASHATPAVDPDFEQVPAANAAAPAPIKVATPVPAQPAPAAQAAPAAQPAPAVSPKPTRKRTPPPAATAAPAGGTFGAAPAAPAKPAQKPAGGTFGGGAKTATAASNLPPPPMPAQIAAQAATEVADAPADAPQPSGLDNDIASILAELNG